MREDKSLYIFDFLRNFFRLYNIPIMIYLLINLTIIYTGAIMLTQVYAEMFTTDTSTLIDFTSREYYIVTAVVIAIVYFIALAISLSPIGEWLLRRKKHCIPIENSTLSVAGRERLLCLFNEVYNKAVLLEPSISTQVKLFIKADKEPNAFAMGRRTICVTTSLLTLPDEYIKGVLGHEFGHLAHKDTDIGLVINIANWLTNIVFLGVWVLLYICKFSMKLCSFVFAVLGKRVMTLYKNLTDMLFTAMAFLFVQLFQKVWLAVGNLLFLATSRGVEYQADAFSCELGYSNGLVAFFHLLPDAVQGERSSFRKIISSLATVGATHPATWKRIESIQALELE